MLEHPRYISRSYFNALGKGKIEKEDVLLVKDGATIGKAMHITHKAFPRMAVNEHVFILRAKECTYPRFLFYLICSELAQYQISLAIKGAAQPGLGSRFVSDLRVPKPSLEEQIAISDFLDKETSKIDSLIATKERLVELLKENLTSLITRAVTKGLDPTVPMKDSGIESLGRIPEHWSTKRLWHITRWDRPIMYGIVLPGPNVNKGIPIVKGGDVRPERLKLEFLNRTTSEIDAAHARSRLLGGDIVYAIRGSIGDVAIVPEGLTGANLTQDAARISYKEDTCGRWLLYALRSIAVFAQLEAGALGATIRGINIRDLKRAVIPVPPLPEQQAIADFLDDENMKSKRLTGKALEGIERLREYRTALISAAVTGKIDVREEVT